MPVCDRPRVRIPVRPHSFCFALLFGWVVVTELGMARELFWRKEVVRRGFGRVDTGGRCVLELWMRAAVSGDETLWC
ncbi:uncharacterized protein J3D65DRAFT_624816 [Phyllosticta citribraziliensis]|uniref:Secreted protein n=1 Tax=Phyllosticta citribraziliensis TaxID=989973 RepID=A0ABR1LR97_9PEZI